ncbi:MAG TPA: FtsQ-type POTRA domain-containing protein [Miltoncostaeaceae bacterium]|nr:FtsQ-type POTRA domain-containing protein [Miltoncostaeaceae bacterium]
MSTRATRPPAGARPRPPRATHPALARRRREIARARGRRRRSAALFAMGTAAVVLLVYWLATGPLLATSGVSVSGYDRPDRAELVAAVTRAAGEGTIIAPATGDVAAAADRFPWVASVSISRDWPRGMAVRVTEATPAAVASFSDQAVLVSAAGRVGGRGGGGPGVGGVRVEVAPPPAGADVPDGARPALAFIAGADPEVGARVRALQVGADGTWVGRLTGGPELRLGSGSRMAAKATALGLVLADMSAEDEASAAYIDLSSPERPAVGMAVATAGTPAGTSLQ